MKHLRWLDLSYNDIHGDGLAHLAALAELEWLDLSRTKLGEDSLAHLHGLKKLNWLVLPRRKFSRSAVVALDDALPDVELNSEGYTEDWDREIDRALLDFSPEPGFSLPAERHITQIRIVMHEIAKPKGLSYHWVTREERFEFETDDDLMLRAFEEALIGSLWFGVRPDREGVAYMWWHRLGEMHVTTTTDEFVVYITTDGFVLDTKYGSTKNRFLNWSAAMLIDDILFKQTKQRMPRPLFDVLSGEGMRRSEGEFLKEFRARLSILEADRD